MKCPTCDTELASADATCARCGSQPSVTTPNDATVTAVGFTVTMAASLESGENSPSGSGLALQDGAVIADRYRVLSCLGEGGMGAVYKVLDVTLDRVVALKTVHPDMARSPRALEMFKREVILARQVTHKNVCRVFDLGQDRGFYFLTMELVEGYSLRNTFRNNLKFPPAQVAEMMLQVAHGLEAAHETGIIHRDLKPDNLMVKADGRVLVMDFGIARPADESGAAFAGTPAYASPEQLLGAPMDRRSDLFSLGLIFYELLYGKLPYPSPKNMREARERATLKTPALAERDPSIPRELSDIVGRCLALRPEERFENARALAVAIDGWLHPKPFYAKPAFTWTSAGATALVAVAAVVWINRPPPPAPRPVSLLIADFVNKTGEPIFNGTIEPAIQVALEGASFITAFDRGAAKRMVRQLRPSQPSLDEDGARLIAAREGINVVLSGSIDRAADRYRLTLQTVNSADGQPILKEQSQTAARDQILATAGKLAAPVRRALGDRTPTSEQIAGAETFTAASLEAANKYSQGQELAASLGRPEQAAQAYQEAIRLDPDMGRAYAGLAVVNRNLGHLAEALRSYELALSHISRMSEREKLRTRGGYYVTSNNPVKAVEEFSALVQKFPADTGGHANLALALLLLRQTDKALDEGRRSVEIYPKNLQNRNNLALYAMYAGDYKVAAQEASAVLKENSQFEKAYVAIALSSLAQGRAEAAQESYQKLAAVSQRGASMAATGLADLAIMQGRLSDAVKILQHGIELDLGLKHADWAARKYTDLAQVYVRLNRMPEARRDADLGIADTVDLGTLMEGALAYVDAGDTAKAEAIASAFRQKVGAENQATAMLIDGYSQMAAAPVQAIETVSNAQKTLDTWLGHLLLGRANLLAKEFTGAHDELEVCLKRSGEATAVFLDDVPSARLLPPVWYFLAQAEEGIKDGTAAESYRRFLSFLTPQSQDPLAPMALRKAGINVTGER